MRSYDESPTVRQKIREWWKDACEGKDGVSVRDLTPLAAQALRGDPDFCRAFLDETLGPVIYSVGLSVVGEGRVGRPSSDPESPAASFDLGQPTPVADSAGASAPQQGQSPRALESAPTRRVGADEIAAAAARRAGPIDWSRWMEYDPSSGQHLRLFTMTKAQVLAAKHKRSREQLQPALYNDALLGLIAGRMRDDQRVEDVWTEQALTTLAQRILVGRPKVSLGPVGMPSLATFTRE
jgi:hypothetical protein